MDWHLVDSYFTVKSTDIFAVYHDLASASANAVRLMLAFKCRDSQTNNNDFSPPRGDQSWE